MRTCTNNNVTIFSVRNKYGSIEECFTEKEDAENYVLQHGEHLHVSPIECNTHYEKRGDVNWRVTISEKGYLISTENVWFIPFPQDYVKYTKINVFYFFVKAPDYKKAKEYALKYYKSLQRDTTLFSLLKKKCVKDEDGNGKYYLSYDLINHSFKEEISDINIDLLNDEEKKLINSNKYEKGIKNKIG